MQNNNFKNLIPIIFDRKKIIPKNIKKKHIYENISIEIGERLKETKFNYKDTLEINSKINETECIIKSSGKINNFYKTNVNTKNYLKKLLELYGIGLKTLAMLGLLIYWAIIILAPFSQ